MAMITSKSNQVLNIGFVYNPITNRVMFAVTLKLMERILDFTLLCRLTDRVNLVIAAFGVESDSSARNSHSL